MLSRTLVVLLLALAGGQAVAQREGYVIVRGCVIDIDNRPVNRARITLDGLNYRGGHEYTNDGGVTWTTIDGQFEVLMKKGDPKQPALLARLIAWSTVGDARSRERGGTVDREVSNIGKPVDLGKPCLMVEPQYFIGVILEGKNGQVRPDSYSRQGSFYSLQLQLRALGETWNNTMFSWNYAEFQPIFARGTAYELLIVRQPDDEECQPIDSPGGTTGGVGHTYPRRHMLVRYKCVPRKNVIVEALAACAASDGNCRNGCLGVGALSAYNILRGRKGDSSEMDACNAKCNTAQRDCEVQAKALNPPLTLPPVAGGQGQGGQGQGGQRTEGPVPGETSGTPRVPRKSCREAMNDFIEPVNKGNPFKDGGYEKRGYNYNQSVEHSIWAMQQYVRIANRHPACANDADSKQAIQQNLRNDQARCKAGSCVNGRNYGVNEAQLEAAVKQSIAEWNSGSGTAGTEQPSGSGGLPFAECQHQENASDIGAKLNRIPASDTVQKTRGIIAASDFMIRTYSQCLPDRRAQDTVNQYKTVRADSLRTCQQVSNNPSICERSPF